MEQVWMFCNWTNMKTYILFLMFDLFVAGVQRIPLMWKMFTENIDSYISLLPGDKLLQQEKKVSVI